MIISISGLIFSSIGKSGFDSINKTKHGEYKELKLVDGAMSERQGRPLDKLKLEANWVGLNLAASIKDLDVLLTGEHQMSDQDGNNLGVWTCDSFSDNGAEVLGGGFVCHKVTLNLTEFR